MHNLTTYLPTYLSVYLQLCLWFAVLWGLIWLKNPTLRKEMLFLSLGGLCMAPFVEILFFQDWYRPYSIWGNDWIKIESFLFGFFSAGVSGVAVQALSGTQYKTRKYSYAPSLFHEAMGFVVSLLLFYSLFILGWHSFYASAAACAFMIGSVLYRRPDLAGLMLKTMLIVPCIALPGYWIALFTTPSFFEEQWLLQNLSGYWLLGLPLEEVLWFSYSSAVFAGVWKCHTSAQLQAARKSVKAYKLKAA